MNINKGGGISDDHITWLIGRESFSDNSFSGWATPEYDKDCQTAVMKVMDLRSLGGGSDQVLAAEEFFQFFWNKLIDALER
jgi:hypothetical protein